MPATATINLRISQPERALIDQAAQVLGKTRTAFILDNALQAAEEVVLDQTRFVLDEGQWEAMCKAMDTPSKEQQDQQARGLNRLLSTVAPWDKP